jgi:hypothetical protein
LLNQENYNISILNESLLKDFESKFKKQEENIISLNAALLK